MLEQDSCFVYVLDKFGFKHKTMKGSLRRGCNVGFRSVLCEDKRDYFLAVHKDKFPLAHSETCFDDFEYKKALGYTYVMCNKHKYKYKTKPNTLLNAGSHCKHCGLESGNKTKFLTQDDYLDKAKRLHGDTYVYTKTVYKSAREYVTITCREHGDFQCLAYIHMQGCGCQLCGLEKGGFSRSDYKDVCPNGSSVYIMKMRIQEDSFLKVGISKNIKRRIIGLTGGGMSEVELLYQEHFDDAAIAWNVEKMLHREFKSNSYIPSVKFEGFSECFDLSIEDEVIKLLKYAA